MSVKCSLPSNLSKHFSSGLFLNAEFGSELEFPLVQIPGSLGVLVFQISEGWEAPESQN